jgi:thiol-disulfide isomerase/thioredoxin
LSNFEQKEIDSLNLENKLGLAENNLLKDTFLIKYPTGDFLDYLWQNRERYLRKSVTFTRGDIDKYIVKCFKVVEGATQYSKEIKEYELFNYIFYMLDSGGPSPVLDSIAGKLEEKYPACSEYLAMLTDKYKKLSPLMPGNPAPHLQGISPEGKVYSLNDFKDKVIFIDIWATWCGPCIEALPHIIELQKKFIENNEVVFIFLSHDGKEGKWDKYLSDHPEFKGVHLRARKEEDRPFETLWKVTGIPRYMIIDKQGKIIDAFARQSSYEKLKGVIEQALLK